MGDRKIQVFGIAVIMLVMLSCSWPLMNGGAENIPSLTPNLTMTAFFGSGIMGSLTPVVQTEVVGVIENPTATFTSTSTSTHTPEPTATATAVPSITPTVSPPPTLTPKAKLKPRPGANVAAAFFTSPPALDGNWDEWVTPEYGAKTVTYGGGNWVSEADLSSTFRVGWDMKNLYVAARVRDDVYVQNASGYDIYKGDSLEILLDGDLAVDYYYNVLSPDDYQLGISPGNPNVYGGKEAYLWFPRYLAGSKSQVQIAALPLSDGYQVEAAIPWSVFGITPIAGARYGFAFSVSDNDNTTQNIQHSMVSSASNRHLTQPMTWGEIFLNP